jgi:hypothetical protein
VPEPVDEKQMKVRYAGVCPQSGADLPARLEAIYEGSTRTTRSLGCSPEAPVVEESVLSSSRHPGSIDVSMPGASVRRECKRRQAKRETRIREKQPRLSGLLLSLSDDPQSTTAWNCGAFYWCTRFLACLHTGKVQSRV